MARYAALSDRVNGATGTGLDDITHLIWPESAFPFFLTREAEALAQIAKLLPAGAVLITGAVRAPETVPSEAVTRAYNSIYVLDHAHILIYDKVHLVPFGEYHRSRMPSSGSADQLVQVKVGHAGRSPPRHRYRRRRRCADLLRVSSRQAVPAANARLDAQSHQ
jgi:hypothetical protein